MGIRCAPHLNIDKRIAQFHDVWTGSAITDLVCLGAVHQFTNWCEYGCSARESGFPGAGEIDQFTNGNLAFRNAIAKVPGNCQQRFAGDAMQEGAIKIFGDDFPVVGENEMPYQIPVLNAGSRHR